MERDPVFTDTPASITKHSGRVLTDLGLAPYSGTNGVYRLESDDFGV